MANISAYRTLQSLANVDYAEKFAAIEKIQMPSIQKVGESIPRDKEGKIAYVNSMTPTQIKKVISISVLVVSILATTAVVIAAIMMRNHFIYVGLFPSGIGIVGSGLLTTYYFTHKDLASPKERQKETEEIRSHKLTLSQINERYQNFGVVVGYGLMGDAPAASYEQAAHLSLKQAEADRIYSACLSQIQSAYRQAIKPARTALDRAEDAESYAVINTATAGRRNRMLPAIATMNASFDKGYASAQYNDTLREVGPAYKQAIEKLHHCYQAATEPLANAYRKIEL